MKATTRDWLISAEDDLIAAQKLSKENRLTGVVIFHCQQFIEKSFKAVIEENRSPSFKSHDLIRLQIKANINLRDQEKNLLGIINEVYIDSRYPGDLGLMPHGKPTISEIETFIKFTESLFTRIKNRFIKFS